MTRRRLKERGGIRVTPAGRHEARIRGWDRDESGARSRPFQIARTCDTPRDAQEALAKIRAEAQLRELGLHRASLPVVTVAAALELHRKADKAWKWTPQRKSAWSKLRPFHALPVGAITDGDVTGWAARFVGEPTYRRHCFDLLRYVCLRAVALGVVERLRFTAKPSGIPSAKAGKAMRKPIAPAAVTALLLAADASDATAQGGLGDLGLRLRLLLHTACRPAELARLTWAAVKPARSLLDSAPADCDALDFPAHKGGHPHVAPLSPSLTAALAAHRGRVAMARGAARAGEPLFPVLIDGAWTERAAVINWATVRRTMTAAGVEGAVLYQLRHTRLSDIAHTHSPMVAATLVGHTTTRITQTYLTGRPSLSVDALYRDTLSLTEGEPDPKPPTPRAPSPQPSGATSGAAAKARAGKGKARGLAAYHDSKTATPEIQEPKTITRQAPETQALDTPPEGRLGALAARVVTEGPDGIADAVVAHLGALQARKFAGGLTDALGGEPEDIRGVLRALCERVTEKSGGGLAVCAVTPRDYGRLRVRRRVG